MIEEENCVRNLAFATPRKILEIINHIPLIKRTLRNNRPIFTQLPRRYITHNEHIGRGESFEDLRILNMDNNTNFTSSLSIPAKVSLHKSEIENINWIEVLTKPEKEGITGYTNLDFLDVNRNLRSRLNIEAKRKEFFYNYEKSKDAFRNSYVVKIEDLVGLVFMERGFLSTSRKETFFILNNK